MSHSQQEVRGQVLCVCVRETLGELLLRFPSLTPHAAWPTHNVLSDL